MYIIFDLDGTLADMTHRLSHIQKKPKDWDSFYAACLNDEPIEQMLALCRTLAHFNTVDIWSGRSDVVRVQTEFWLKKYGINYRTLKMRRDGDYRQDYIVKGEWADTLLAPPDVVFDDRQQVVDMWRSRGVRCCQVAPGDF